MSEKTTETNETKTAGKTGDQKEKVLLTKMSIATLGCNPKVASARPLGDTTPIPLCAIYGIATGIKVKEDKATGNVWTPLVGEFEAVNLQSGETFISSVLYMPSGIHDVVEQAVMNPTDPENFNRVEFALEIRAVRANNPIGYSYQGVPRVAVAARDPLAHLRSSVASQIKLPETRPVPQIAAPEGPGASKNPKSAKDQKEAEPAGKSK